MYPLIRLFQNSEGEVLDVHDDNNSKHSYGICYGKHLGKMTHQNLAMSPSYWCYYQLHLTGEETETETG